MVESCEVTYRPEEFEYGHVVCAERLAGLASSDNISDKCGPIVGPLLLHYLYTHQQQHQVCPGLNTPAHTVSGLTHIWRMYTVHATAAHNSYVHVEESMVFLHQNSRR